MRNKRKNSALPSHQCETRKDLLMVTTTTSKAGTASPSYPYSRVSLAECGSDHFVHKRRESPAGARAITYACLSGPLCCVFRCPLGSCLSLPNQPDETMGASGRPAAGTRISMLPLVPLSCARLLSQGVECLKADFADPLYVHPTRRWLATFLRASPLPSLPASGPFFVDFEETATRRALVYFLTEATS